jgi:hypothetical protein
MKNSRALVSIKRRYTNRVPNTEWLVNGIPNTEIFRMVEGPGSGGRTSGVLLFALVPSLPHDSPFAGFAHPLPPSLHLSLRSWCSAMADYHFVYKDVEGASTQWDDIQRRLGNLPPKPEPFKPPPFAPKVDAGEQPKSKEWLDEREAEELEELEDDLDDDRFLEQYR